MYYVVFCYCWSSACRRRSLQLLPSHHSELTH